MWKLRLSINVILMLKLRLSFYVVFMWNLRLHFLWFLCENNVFILNDFYVKINFVILWDFDV